jgi:hypothetical protein
MTKAALRMSAVNFPPFFCRAFESYSAHKTSTANLYLVYNFVSSPSINLDKYQDGLTFLAGEDDSRDFRFLFAGREGSDEARIRELDVLARLLSTSLREGSEIEDAGFSSTE